jgi:DNA mismatch repair protein MutS2
MATQAERAAARLIPTGESGGARADARAALDAIEDRLRRAAEGGVAAAAVPAAPARPARVGDRVLVGALGLEGVVLSMQGRDAEVGVRGKRLRARIADLHVTSAGAPPAPAPVRVNVDLQAREGLLTELNLIGSTADDALVRLEKFLDDASMTEQRTVRVIHGFGTGQLRRAIGDWLRTHPSVASFNAAPPDKGGGGVTVVELKE